ncbi:hypothetical protein ACFS4T_08480 [Pseudomonas lini]
MAKAIVSTVKPNAKDTPQQTDPHVWKRRRQDRTAAPPNTNQNVPTNSVAERLNKDIANFPVEITLSLCIQQMDYRTISRTLPEYSRVFNEIPVTMKKTARARVQRVVAVRRSNVGAGLLAKAVCHPTLMLNVMALSRASPLPH